MANVPNIPSVVVTIEDRSYLQPVLQSGRTVLIPFFSKYGKEDFVEWSDWEEYELRFGKSDPKKYGKAQLYIKGASQFTQSFLGKRLLATDAAYANQLVSYDASGAVRTSLSNQTDVDGIEASSPDKTLGFVGNGRGDGYNDIVVKFSPLDDYSKFYADEDGLEKYTFNFLSAKIYEKQSNGSLIQISKDPIPFALVSEDPDTHVSIKDIYDNMSLEAASRFEDQSDYLAAFQVDAANTLVENLNVDSIGSPLLYDGAKGQTAFISFEDGTVEPYYVSRPQSESVDQIRVHWVDGGGADHYDIIKIVDAQITITDDSATGPLPGDIEDFNIIGTKAFYKVTLNENGNFVSAVVNEARTSATQGMVRYDAGFDLTDAAIMVNDYVLKETSEYTIDGTVVTFIEPLNYGDDVYIRSANTAGNAAVVVEPIFFERYNLWKSLIKEGVQLFNGTSGANLYINGLLNFNGPGTTGSENAKMLLLDFYMTDATIREVLYPKYDFDYVPDFTDDSDVQAAITNLNDYIQTAFGIHSCGIKYDYTQDIKYRKYNLGISSFNNAIYSGQANRKHYDSDLGRTIFMPLSYYALLSHLYIDGTMGISEPVANVDKGSLRTGTIDLTYTATSNQIEKCRMKQINMLIDEPDGIYFIDQLTMYKRSSILSRIHAIKPVQKVKKDLRKLLKTGLQSKNGKAAEMTVRSIVDRYMVQWVYSDKNIRGAFEYYNVAISFNESNLTLDVMLTVKPVRSVEKINVTINVV